MKFPRPFFKPRQPGLQPRRARWVKSTWRGRLPGLVLLSLGSGVACAYLDYRPNPREATLFTPLEQAAHSFRMGVYGAKHFDKIKEARRKIVLVTINDSTFSDLGGPPIPRRYHARIVRDLSRAGAKVIAFDLLFKSHSLDPADDHDLVQAAAQSGRVLWACLFQNDDHVSKPGKDDEPPVSDPPVRAIKALRDASPHEGHINSGAFVLDNPIVDHVSPVLPDAGRLIPSFSFQAARMATDPDAPLQRIAGGWRSGSLAVPADSNGDFPITFLRPPSSGERDWVFPVIPYERIEGGAVDEEFFRDHKFFRGKIVLVGDNSKIGNDQRPTPVGEMPGVEIHAHAIATILSGAYILPAPAWADVLASVFMGGVVCLLAAARHLRNMVLGVLGVGLAFAILNVSLFVLQGWSLHLVAPLVALALASVATLIEDGLFQERERERMFEAFVKASASAIESRDPATSGHSLRVTELCVALAQAVTDINKGPLKHVGFSKSQIKELRYASLLHDFGKIGVSESVLTKSHKLPPDRFEAVQCRLALAHSQAMLQRARGELQVLVAREAGGSHEQAETERSYEEQMEQMERDAEFLRKSNDPMVAFLPESDYDLLQQVLSRLGETLYQDSQGQVRPVVTPEEREALSIRKGSLTAREYREIQEHSQLSYDFLKQIPWTDSMAEIPEIAYGHHEKLNGSGYPRRLQAAQIPLTVRIMTIADIYDALTSADRPYKKAMPVERALAILQEEARKGDLDGDLLRVFIEHKVYEKADVPAPAPGVVPSDAQDANAQSASSLRSSPSAPSPSAPSRWPS